MNYSLTYTARIVSFIVAGSVIFGFDVDQGHLTEVVQAGLIITSEVVTLYGRYRAGGINWFGLKIGKKK